MGMGGPCQALPREHLAPELSCLCSCPWWVGQRCHLLARGYQLHLLCPWVDPGPVMLGGCSSGCWLGLGRVGSSPQHPCSVWFVFFLGPCLSAHLPLPDLRRCPCLDLPTPKGLAPGSPGLDVVYGSVVTVPLQNKDCSGLPGPLPPAAWELGRAGGWGEDCPTPFLAGPHTDLCSVDSELSQETHTCV